MNASQPPSSNRPPGHLIHSVETSSPETYDVGGAAAPMPTGPTASSLPPSLWADPSDGGPLPLSPPRPNLLNEQTASIPYLPVIDEPAPTDASRLALAGGAGVMLVLLGWLLVMAVTDGSNATDGEVETAASDQLSSAVDDLSGATSTTRRPPAAAFLTPLGPTNDEAAAVDQDTSSTGSTAPRRAPEITATAPATTTTTSWTEPSIPPESEWVDTGHGVMVPDILLRIRFCESTNNYKAANSYSTARGAYQFLKGSWDWYGHATRTGVPEAHLASPAEQDAAALRTLQRDGTRPWLASRTCWADPAIDSRYADARPRTTTTMPGSGGQTDPSSGSGSSSTVPGAVSTTTVSTTTTQTGQPTTSTTRAVASVPPTTASTSTTRPNNPTTSSTTIASTTTTRPSTSTTTAETSTTAETTTSTTTAISISPTTVEGGSEDSAGT